MLSGDSGFVAEADRPLLKWPDIFLGAYAAWVRAQKGRVQNETVIIQQPASAEGGVDVIGVENGELARADKAVRIVAAQLHFSALDIQQLELAVKMPPM